MYSLFTYPSIDNSVATHCHILILLNYLLKKIRENILNNFIVFFLPLSLLQFEQIYPHKIAALNKAYHRELALL